MPLARRREKREPDIPTDSVSDIAFLLIIFFILTTTLAKLTGFQSELPSADASQRQAQNQPKTPGVQLANGKLLFNEQEVTPQVLRERLLDLRLGSRQGEDKVVMLEAAGKVDYQTYFETMAAITTAGGVVAIVEEE